MDVKRTQESAIHKRLRKKVIACTERDAEFVDTAWRSGVLKSLDVDVYPQLELVEFYRGYRTPVPFDYVPQSIEVYLHHVDQKRHRHTVSLPKILSQHVAGQITFTGPAGSGKTTLLKSIARNIISAIRDDLSEIEYVHFLQGRDLSRDYELTPAELLLHKVEDMSNAELREYISFASTNPSKVLFIIDSLDTLPYALEEESRKIVVNDRAFPGTILWNLLTGSIFPGVKIITSSREHTIRNYEAKLRAEKVIALSGLTQECIRRVIEGYFGVNAKYIIDELETKYPSLMNLCSVPVFLTYTMIGYDSDADFKPSTMTGVLALVLQSLLRSDHTHVENIAEVIHKLKELAFIGTKEKRVLFSTGELDRYQLKQDDVGDLTVSAPGRNQKLVVLESSQFQTGSSLFFNHQSLQEQLTAYFIAEMELEEFKEYLEQNIHTPYYTVVRRLLCGIMLDEKLQRTSQALMKRIPSSEHKAALVQSMQDQLGKCRETNALELLISFNEAGGGLDDVISTHLSVIDVRRVTLSPSEAYAVSSVLSRCKYLKMLNMSFCNLNPNLLNIIRSCLKDSNARIESLDLTANADMGPEGLAAVGEIVKSCELVNLNLQQCNISPVDIQRLNTAVGNAKITKLRLSYNKQMGEEGFFALGEITNRCKVENLELMRCELKAREVETFRKSLEDSKVKIINLTENDTYNQADYVLPVAELTELLPHISETLDLTRSILQSEDEWMLQKKLDELHPTHLKIVIGGKHNLEVLESRKARNSRISDMPSKAHSEDSDLHSCLEKHIWPGEGGLIELHGCSLQFPPNTLDEESNIKICVVIDPTVPDDYKAISPSLSSKISGAQLNEGSSIEAVLLAWCYADRTGALYPTTVEVDLLCRESEAGQWSRIRSVNLEKDRKVRFKTSKVCDYVLGIKRSDFPTLSLNYPMHARITYNALGKVRVYIYIADEGTAEEVERVCKNDGFKQALDQKTFTTKIWNDHKFELLCTSSPEEFAIVGDQSTFFFNGDLKHKGFVQFELRLEPLPKRKTGRFLEFDFKIYVCHLLDHGSSFRIPWEISSELTIGPEGGKIDVEDCSISFPHNSLHLPSNISISPHLDSKRFPIPPGYAPICPILQCEPSGLKFANPAMITLPSWIETSFPLPVDIFCGKIRDGSLVWGREATVALDRGRGIEFSCNHFTPYFAGIVLDAIKLYLGFIYDIRPYLYQRSEGRFCAGVCVNNLTKIREIEEDMESHGYTSVFPRLNSVRVNLNENIEIDLKCFNRRKVNVTAPPEKKVSINQEFARTLESPMYFSLPKPKDGDTEQFLLQFSVHGVFTPIRQNFRYYWKDEKDSGVNIQHAEHVNVQQ